MIVSLLALFGPLADKFFLVLARNMDMTAFTELDENLSTFLLLFPNFESFKIFELSVKACLNPGQSLIGFPVVLLDRKPKMILTLCWFCSLAPQSCDPWTGSLWVCLGGFLSTKELLCSAVTASVDLHGKNAEWKNKFYKYIKTIRILCCVFITLPALKPP